MTTDNYEEAYALGRKVRFISPSGKSRESTFATREDALAYALDLAERGARVWDWEDRCWINGK